MKGHFDLDLQDESELARGREGPKPGISGVRPERASRAVEAYRLCSDSQLQVVGRGFQGCWGPWLIRKEKVITDCQQLP